MDPENRKSFMQDYVQAVVLLIWTSFTTISLNLHYVIVEASKIHITTFLLQILSGAPQHTFECLYSLPGFVLILYNVYRCMIICAFFQTKFV